MHLRLQSIRAQLMFVMTAVIAASAIASGWAAYGLAQTPLALIALIVAIVLLGAGGANLLAGRYTQRLVALEKTATAIAAGDLEARAPIDADDEIGRLALAVNRMTDELTDSYVMLGERVAERTRELEQSNAELEQFAYVASHDLQEPLRKVASFCQLLQERYAGQLDEDADKFIHYAVDGALRMKTLVTDLLHYSRVGRKHSLFEPVDAGAALEQAIGNLEAAIEESGAEVTSGALPTVAADQSHLIQLFQNLIGNAIKYRGERSPTIHASARADGEQWVFSVKDNGIGVPPDSYERIFLIFQRLHGRNEYSGTGIGLAVCKKIVECLGGRIWVESVVGEGSVFYFTLPADQASTESGDDRDEPHCESGTEHAVLATAD